MNQFYESITPPRSVWQVLFALILIILNAATASSQEKRAKVRISNAGLTITALPLLAARDWGTFKANGLDVEIIVMSPPLGAAAMAQGDIDYVAGVGPASVAATLTRFAIARDLVFLGSDLLLDPGRAAVQDAPGSQRQKDRPLRRRRRYQPRGVDRLPWRSPASTRKTIRWSPYRGSSFRSYYSLESGFVDAALMSPPHIFAAAKKGFNKLMDVGAMVEMPGGGLTAMVKTIQAAPGRNQDASSARCKSPKMRCANPNPRPSS